jgi:hypothetical protein
VLVQPDANVISSALIGRHRISLTVEFENVHDEKLKPLSLFNSCHRCRDQGVALGAGSEQRYVSFLFPIMKDNAVCRSALFPASTTVRLASESWAGTISQKHVCKDGEISAVTSQSASAQLPMHLGESGGAPNVWDCFRQRLRDSCWPLM